MRIWSLHPQYLDAKGLVALWRETLLAKHVLEGRTRGYTNHPQLDRFRACGDPLQAVNDYLRCVLNEAQRRGYKFNDEKITRAPGGSRMQVPKGQMLYESSHLLKKLEVRDPRKFEEVKQSGSLLPHPIFSVVEGGIAAWEVLEKSPGR